MKKIIFSLLTATLLIASGVSLALTCPSVSSVQAHGVGTVKMHEDQGYISINMSSYDDQDLSHTWVFAMGLFDDAKNIEDAYKQAKSALRNIGNPQVGKILGDQRCIYFTNLKSKNGDQIFGMAFIIH